MKVERPQNSWRRVILETERFPWGKLQQLKEEKSLIIIYFMESNFVTWKTEQGSQWQMNSKLLSLHKEWNLKLRNSLSFTSPLYISVELKFSQNNQKSLTRKINGKFIFFSLPSMMMIVVVKQMLCEKKEMWKLMGDLSVVKSSL